MQWSARTVSMDLIDRADQTFVMTYGRQVGQLKRSITCTGLINRPYLVFSEQNETFLIVCGSLRIAALEGLGINEIAANVFDASPAEKELFLFSLHDNLSHRVFNPVELARSVAGLLRYIPEETVISHYLPLLGIPPTVAALEKYICLVGLEKEVLDGIIDGAVAEKSAIALSALAKQDRIVLFNLFRKIHASASKQTELIETCCDMAKRDGASIHDILQHPEITRICSNEKLTAGQKGERIRMWLKKKRFPRFVKKEELFVACKKKCPFPRGVDFLPPPFFEGNKYRLLIDVERPEDLSSAAQKLKELAESAQVQALFEEHR